MNKNEYSVKGLAHYQHYTFSTPPYLRYERCYIMDPSDTHLLIESGGTAEIPHP